MEQQKQTVLEKLLILLKCIPVIILSLAGGLIIGLFISSLFNSTPSLTPPEVNFLGKPESATPLLPGESFEVHPAAENVGGSAVYVYITVTIHEFEGLPVLLYETNPGWMLVEERKESEAVEEDHVLIIRTYAYSRAGEILPLGPGETTTTLLDSMTVRADICYSDIPDDALGCKFDMLAGTETLY